MSLPTLIFLVALGPREINHVYDERMPIPLRPQEEQFLERLDGWLPESPEVQTQPHRLGAIAMHIRTSGRLA